MEEFYSIGSGGGLGLDLTELLAILDECSPVLQGADREVAESHLRTVLSASAAAASGDLTLGRRIGEGRYLAVGALGGLGLSIVLGPLLHLVAVGAALRSARRLLAFDSEWRPRIITIYARLEGAEREVFEAVHEVQNRWIVTNYDALAEGRYEQAYGQVAPTAADITATLNGRLDPESAAAALARLAKRGILASDGVRYWIRF